MTEKGRLFGGAVALMAVMLLAPGVGWGAMIEFGSAGLTGQSWEAVLDGGPPNTSTAYVRYPDPSGGNSYRGNNWGNYQGAGWLATKWQQVTSPGDYLGYYLWVDNFNVLEAIFGPDPANRQEVQLGAYDVVTGFDSLNVALSTSLPQKAGRIFDYEWDTAAAAGLTGTATLSQIIFSAGEGGISPSTGYERQGIMTLVGLMQIGGTEYEFRWSLGDFSEGQPSIRSVLNQLQGKPQINLGNVAMAPTAAVPEPGTMLLFATALGVVGLVRRRSQG